MNTPTHLLIGAAALARARTTAGAPVRRWHNTAVLAGALVPDLALYVMFVWMRGVAGVSEETLWREVYWREAWQTAFAVGNAVAVYLALLAVGWWARRHDAGALLVVFALAALLHLAFDFPVHHDDAHRHFWPFSDWRFVSPVSYWDSDYHGEVVGYVEMALAVALIVILWRRFRGSRWVAAALTAALASYVAVPLYFSLMLGG